MRVTNHKKRDVLATISFGVVKVVIGLFMIWGQFVFAERGTLYGFYWPHSLHDLLANGRTIVLFVVAGWLIYTGIRGTKPTPPERRKGPAQLEI